MNTIDDSAVRPSNGEARVTPPLAALLYFSILIPAVAAPRAMPVILTGLVLAALIGNGLRRDPLRVWLPWSHLATALTAFAGWALFSAFWSPAPLESATKGIALALIVLIATVAIGSAQRSAPHLAEGAAKGLLAVVALMALVVIVEVTSGQILRRTLLESFPALIVGGETRVKMTPAGVIRYITDSDINRLVCATTLFALPAWLATGAVANPALRTAARVLLAAFAAAVVVLSSHESSKVAVLLALAVLGLWRWNPKAALRTVAAGWIAAVVLVMPLALLLNHYELHKNPRLPDSAQSRIVIWHYTTRRTADRPIIGHGADSTARINQREIADHIKALSERQLAYKDFRLLPRLGEHAHNIYLQTWFELGLVGAALLAAAGLAAVAATAALPAAMAPWFLAQFAATAAMFATSYGLWQVWVQATVAAALLLLTIACNAARRPA